MALDGFAGGVVDEEYGDVYGIAFSLHFLDSRVDLALCQVVHRVAIVAYEAVCHHFEEAVSAEELCEVFAGGVAALLVEMHQALATILIVATAHRVLAQHLEEAGIELGIVAQHVVVEEEAIVHVGERPNVVGVKVAIYFIKCS